MKRGKITGIIAGILRGNPLAALCLAVCVAGAIVCALLPPLVLENIVNELAQGNGALFGLAALYFGALALSGLFDAAKEMLITVFGQKMTRGIRHEMCAKLSRLPAGYFTRTEPGVTTSRFVGDVDTLEALFTSGIVSMFVDACKMLSILAMIFIKSRGLGILMLAVTPVLFFVTRAVQKRMLAAQLANRVAVGRTNNQVPETVRNIRMIRTFHKEKYMEDSYDSKIEASYQAMEKSNFYDAIYSPIVNIISAAIIAIMMVMAATGGSMQAFFGMSVGTAVAVIAYVGKVFDPMESIGMEIQSIQSALASVKRIREFLDEPERAGIDPALTLDMLKNSGAPAVELEHAVFSYDGVSNVLDDRSFTVQAGESATLAGRTGAGKSTIFKLLLGYYVPGSGHVRIFGTDAARIPDSQKRRLFGYVEQSFRPVPGSVGDQIAVFDEGITQADIEKAAQLAGIHDTICALPQGYDTPYTDGLFSQGQRQLIAVARAVAANPQILLLDEITANLDSDTEEKVLSALKQASRSRTVISISHRLYEQTGGRVINI